MEVHDAQTLMISFGAVEIAQLTLVVTIVISLSRDQKK
jgi:hypothetical protein